MRKETPTVRVDFEILLIDRSGEFCVGKLIVSTNAGRNWCYPQIVNQQTCHQPLQA